jgi:hypothetical protein
MKCLLACLLIGCLVSPVWSTERGMTLEEFVQKLEETNPWTREKVEAQLGIKLTMIRPDARTLYSVSGSFVYGKELIANEIDLDVSADTNKTNMITVALDDKSNCIAWERIIKSYPSGHVNFDSALTPGGNTYYIEKRPWGELLFGFNTLKRKDCLGSITIITNEFIKTR